MTELTSTILVSERDESGQMKYLNRLTMNDEVRVLYQSVPVTNGKKKGTGVALYCSCVLVANLSHQGMCLSWLIIISSITNVECKLIHSGFTIFNAFHAYVIKQSRKEEKNL